MTTFSLCFSDFFKLLNIYIFLILWQDFGAPLRAAPGGSCPPRYATGWTCFPGVPIFFKFVYQPLDCVSDICLQDMS